jgi:MFS family permease
MTSFDESMEVFQELEGARVSTEGRLRSAPNLSDQTRAAQAGRIVFALIFVGMAVSVMGSLGAPMIPLIARTEHVPISRAQWILTAAMMTGAGSTAVLGRLADGARQRAVIVFTLSVTVLGCVLTAVSGSFLVLVLGRALQGMGFGLLPVNMAVARRCLSRERAGRAIATLSVAPAMGAGIGYPVTGAIVALLNFRAAYWFGAILVTIALILVLLILPARTPAKPLNFDLFGAITLGLGVVGITVVLSEGGSWGWSSTKTLATVAASALLLIIWVRHELKVPNPLVVLRSLRNRGVLTANVTGFLMSMQMYLIVPIIVVFIEIPTVAGFGFGGSVLIAGLALIPLAITSFLASRLMIPYERRFGIRSMIPVGALVSSSASLFFALEHAALWEAFVTMAVAGLGIGFTFAAMPGLIVRAVPRSETGSATGFYQVLRTIGLSMGSAFTAAILVTYTLPGHQLPEIGGFTVALFISSGLGLLAAVLSFVLPGRGVIESQPPLSEQEQAALELMMMEEAEIAGVGLMSGNDHDPFDSAREQP